MPASLERIRNSYDVEPTRQDKDLLRLTAYDNGMIMLDGIPLTDQVNYDPAVGWVGANMVIAQTVAEFHKNVIRRRRDRKVAS